MVTNPFLKKTKPKQNKQKKKTTFNIKMATNVASNYPATIRKCRGITQE